MSKTFKPELAAAVLVESLYSSDKIACEKYGITDRSLRNYRVRLASDTAFSLIFQRKQAESERLWVEAAPIVMFKAMQFIGQAADAVASDPLYAKNPMTIEAVALALKTVAEVHLANQIVGARLKDNGYVGSPETDRSQDEYTKQISTSQPSIEYPN